MKTTISAYQKLKTKCTNNSLDPFQLCKENVSLSLQFVPLGQWSLFIDYIADIYLPWKHLSDHIGWQLMMSQVMSFLLSVCLTDGGWTGFYQSAAWSTGTRSGTAQGQRKVRTRKGDHQIFQYGFNFMEKRVEGSIIYIKLYSNREKRNC